MNIAYSFTDGKGSDMAVEDVDEFHEILAKTVEKNMGINLRELRLGNISLPILSAAEAGTVSGCLILMDRSKVDLNLFFS